VAHLTVAGELAQRFARVLTNALIRFVKLAFRIALANAVARPMVAAAIAIILAPVRARPVLISGASRFVHRIVPVNVVARLMVVGEPVRRLVRVLKNALIRFARPVFQAVSGKYRARMTVVAGLVRHLVMAMIPVYK
jgi:hypothetical protein